jgi:hypothetical protein
MTVPEDAIRKYIHTQHDTTFTARLAATAARLFSPSKESYNQRVQHVLS